VHLPWQVHERGTVYRQLSAQPPHRLLPLKKNLNHFCLDCHSVCDNVYCVLTMFSALAAVCTVYCAIEIVLITLHYITWLGLGLGLWLALGNYRLAHYAIYKLLSVCIASFIFKHSLPLKLRPMAG